MSLIGLLKKGASLAAEICGSLLLVAAAYLFFMLLLSVLFPSGTPLKELMVQRTEPPARPRVRERAPELEATLSALVRDVGFRRGDSLTWGVAKAGMPLYSQDAVQTFDHSGASISFNDHDHLDLGSNSSLQVHRINADDRHGGRRYRVLLQGDLRGEIAPKKGLRMDVATAGHQARIGASGAKFQVLRIDRESSGISVFSGEAELVGKHPLRIAANFGVTLTKGYRPEVRPLPEVPTLEQGDGVLAYRLRPAKVRFAWSGGAGEYHFQLSRSPLFAETIVDARLTAPLFSTSQLQAGSYYWRVSRLEEGIEGRYSRLGRLELRECVTPPRLAVSFPEQQLTGKSCRVTGHVEPGTRVFLDGRAIKSTAAGEFGEEVRLEPGVNLIRVEALDEAGNASYASKVVYRKAAQHQGEATLP